MATRTRKTWKPSAKGYYERQVGWKLTKTGKIQQHKFLLGTDLRKAQHRERKLLELWENFEETQNTPRPLWPPGLLEMAKRVAKGASEIAIPRKPDEMQATYAGRLRRLQSQYPVVCFVPADQHAFEVGQEALRLFEAIETDVDPTMVTAPALEQYEAWRVAHTILEDAGLELDVDRFRQMLRPNSENDRNSNEQTRQFRNTNTAPVSITASSSNAAAATSQPKMAGSFHSALRAYSDSIEKEYYRPELEQLTPWGRTQVRQIETLIEHHKNRPLFDLDADGVEELIAHWRRRPLRKNSKEPIKAESASHYISILKRFFRWLHKSSRYDWRKPEDFNEINCKVAQITSDNARCLQQVDTFSLEELILLMRYGQPLDRLLILLGLNCGFGTAEIATLRVGEASLHKAHLPRFQEILGYKTTEADSFIKRVRRKNGVYGEFILFPMTVRGIEWALQIRGQHDDFDPQSRLLLNENGNAFDKPTRSGNRNQQIPNHFSRLIERVRDDQNEISSLSFGKLRKTAGDLIRRFSDGEVMAVFHCRGRAVKTDDLSDVYSNRPFGKVFSTIRKVERYLAPVFEAAGPYPFDPQPLAYTKRKTIERIMQLHTDGCSATDIAASVNVSAETVQRHIKRRPFDSRFRFPLANRFSEVFLRVAVRAMGAFGVCGIAWE